MFFIIKKTLRLVLFSYSYYISAAYYAFKSPLITCNNHLPRMIEYAVILLIINTYATEYRKTSYIMKHQREVIFKISL